MAKKKADDADMEVLMKLTKRMKSENVQVAPKGQPKPGSGKWKTVNPKFKEKPAAPPPKGPTVQAGGMDVDPERAAEYEAWRQEKEAQQKASSSQTRRSDHP